MHEDASEILAQTMLFGALDDAILQRLASVSQLKTYDKGQVVLLAGEPGGDILVVGTGRLKVLTRSADGNDMVLAQALPGDTIGELSLFDLAPRAATVEAQLRSTVLTVPHEVVRKLIRETPDLAEELLRQQAIMIRRSTGLVSDLVFLDLPKRVAKYIVERADRNNKADLGLSQTDLASSIGGVRQSVNAALKGFERRGWIKVEGRIVDVLDREALDKYVSAAK